MIKAASCFTQILNLIDRPAFAKIIFQHQAERFAKGFSSWEQFTAMLFAQLSGANSLREIEGGLASAGGKLVHLNMHRTPSHSTLSYANSHRPWQVYQSLFEQLLTRAYDWSGQRKRKFRFHNPLVSMDSTVIDLCLSMYEWAKFRRTKGAVKIHLQLDHQEYLPRWALVTDGKTHDVTVAKKVHFEPETVIVMDKAYNDYGMFGAWTDSRVWFVTRMKNNALYRVVERRKPPRGSNVRVDQVIRLTGVQTEEKCPHRLRRIVVWNEEQKRRIVLLTNRLDWSAATIGRIYKERWQIEIFFKAIKQNLCLRTFVGTSENAVKTQIWISLIAILLLKYLQLRSTFSWSLSNLAAMVRMNMLVYREFWKWLNRPFAEVEVAHPLQLKLPLGSWTAQGTT
jgi:hypothetical protein